MNRFIRRGFFGALAGSAAGAPLLFLSATGGPEFAVAVAAGSMYGAYVPPARGAYADSIMAAASLGIPIWGITSVILLPSLSANHMAWDAVGMQGHFAPLVGWILFGALLGGILQIVSEIAEIRYGPETAPGAQSESSPTGMFRERSLRIASWRLAQLRGNRCGFMVQFRLPGNCTLECGEVERLRTP
jgi:hypothetical protein